MFNYCTGLTLLLCLLMSLLMCPVHLAGPLMQMTTTSQLIYLVQMRREKKHASDTVPSLCLRKYFNSVTKFSALSGRGRLG